MPLPSKSAPSADEAAALVFWLIKHGTTSLARVIEHQIRLLRRALLPWLISQYHTLLAVLVSPLWQRFTRKLKQMLDSEIARCCHQILRAWLKHISKSMTAGKELDRPAAAAEESSDQKAFSNVMEDSSSAPGLQQQPSLRTAAEPSAIPASFENIEQQLSTIRHSPVRTADMALITPRSTNKSHSRTDVGWPVSSADDIHDSPLSTPHSRKPFAGNWSSGAAWLQSQATMAAVEAATTAAASVQHLSNATGGASTKSVARSGGRHRRNTPTASSFMLNRAFSSSALSHSTAAALKQAEHQSPHETVRSPTLPLQQRSARRSHTATVSSPRAVIRSPRPIANSRTAARSPEAVASSSEKIVEDTTTVSTNSDRASDRLTDKQSDQNAGSPSIRSAEQALQQASAAVETLKKRFAAHGRADQRPQAAQMPCEESPTTKQEAQIAVQPAKASEQGLQEQGVSAEPAAGSKPSSSADVDSLVVVPDQQSACADSPDSTSDSLHDPVRSRCDSANAPVMWFNGAAADSDQSVGTQIQDSGAECNSREPQPDDILPAEQLEGNAAVSPLADANEAVHAQHLNILEQVWEGCQQQQHAEQAVIRQTLSLSDEQSGVHQQQHGAADPAQMQSAESLSAWLGSEAASRTASIGLADTPPLEAPSAGFQTDSCASIPVHHCATADTAADLSNSDEHGQDSHQLPVTRRHVQEADVIGGVEKSQHIQPPTSAPPASAVNRLQYSQLSVSQGDTNEPECDIYNLESPGPILIAGHNGTLGDSYMLALSRPEASLRTWHPKPCPPLLEGHGLGTFLGPPAQRWSAGVAPKDSTNVATSPNQEPGSHSMSRLPLSGDEAEGCSQLKRFYTGPTP